MTDHPPPLGPPGHDPDPGPPLSLAELHALARVEASTALDGLTDREVQTYRHLAAARARRAADEAASWARTAEALEAEHARRQEGAPHP